MSNLNSIESISNIVNPKKKVNSIFVVPTASSSSSNQHQTTTPTATTSSSQILTIQKNQIQSSSSSTNNNKITVIPINLNNNINLNTSTSSSIITKTVPTTTTPIKIINNSTTTPLNPLNTNTKKIVINNNLNHITKTIGSVNISTNNNNESINKPVHHVVKIINTPLSSGGIRIATVQNNNNNTSALASLLNTSDLANQQPQQQPLKLHTYQINKQPKLSTNNVYVQPTTTTTINQQTSTVVHKIPSTSITKTISSIAPNNKTQINTIMSIKSQNENNIPTSQQQQQQNIRPQITVISANSNHKIIHNTITTNVNNNKSNLNESLNENDNILDTDAIKLIYDSLQMPPSNSNNIASTTSSSTSNNNNNQENSQNLKTKNSNDSNNRKPCNCTKSMCLKLYCDCFAMGSFCHNCNCINCSNTLEHEDERNKAVKLVLERNPTAFQSKIGKFTFTAAASKSPNINEQSENSVDDIQSRHIKGCNCKKSNCLKRYCECYLAKIQCSTLCKCVGCKNCDESTRSLLQLANAAEMRKQQQINCSSRLNKYKNEDDDLLPSKSKYFMSKSYAFINSEVAEATSQCLIAQAEESEHQEMNQEEIERLVIEEFGRCLVEIIESAESSALKITK